MHKVIAIAVVMLAGCSLYGDDDAPIDVDAALEPDARQWAPSWSEIACIAACDPDEGLSRCGDPQECGRECERAEAAGGAWCPCSAGEACDPIASLCTWLCAPERALCAGAEVDTCIATCVSGAEEGAGLCPGQL